MVFKNLKSLFLQDTNSLKSKFLYQFSKYYIYLLMTFFILEFFYYKFYLTNLDYNYFISNLFRQILFFTILLFIFRFFLDNIINKHILNRICSYNYDAIDMIKNESCKRLSIQGSDEIDKLAFYINSILERYDNLLELEKNNSLIDPLTSCYNRRALYLNFIGLKDKAIRNKKDISLVLFDIDNFKKINDKYGHNIGDKVLVELSKIIKSIIRKYDSVYRIGGEEFLILLPDLKKNEIDKFIIRLMREITYQLKKRILEIENPITVSGGFVNSKDFDINSDQVLTEMITHADILLYDAKSNGKNKILVK